MQMDATANLLKTIADANQNTLKKMTVAKSHPNLGTTSGKNLSLYQLAQQGISNPDIAWPVFSALWSELTIPNTSENEKFGYRPPILYCADNISHLFGASEYQVLQVDELQPIHALDLTVPRHFIDHITGTKELPNGGVVLGATSKSDTVHCPPLEVGIEMAESRSASPDVDVQLNEFWNPLQSIDQRMMDMCLDLDVMTLKGVSKTEAKTLIEYWAYNGLVRQRIADSFVGEQWTISGGGILGELERTVIKMRF
jgi:small subunit ribosomal protein S29